MAILTFWLSFSTTLTEGQSCSDFPNSNSIVYVNALANGNNNGTTWRDAFNDLQTALSAANSCINIQQIWVVKGTYKPTNGTDRNAAFYLINNVSIYGGFIGNENDLSLRNWVTNPTILSADIGALNFIGDNCYHVIYHLFNNVDNSAVLDGFTITSGCANGDHDQVNEGGGMYNHQAQSPTLKNIIFSNNYGLHGGALKNEANSAPILTDIVFKNNSSDLGGGLENESSSPILTNVTFINNSASHYGGGIANVSGSNPVLNNVKFLNNTAISGGGMFNQRSSPQINNSQFSNNLANDGFGIQGNGGGIYNYDNSSPVLSSVIFVSNVSAYNGGGMYNWANCSPNLTNVIFTSNSCTNEGCGIYNTQSSSSTFRNATFSNNTANNGSVSYNDFSSASSFTNCIFWGNSALTIFNSGSQPNVSYSDIQGGFAGTANINSDPKFLNASNAAGADGIFFTGDDGLELQQCSSAINAGTNNGSTARDIMGNTRPYNNGSTDMGAYEYQGTPNSVLPNGSCGNIVLPLKLLSFVAKTESENIHIFWKTTDEVNVFGFELQRSTNGDNFEKISFTIATGDGYYNVFDKKVSKGVNYYYRLKMIHNDGFYNYSVVQSAVIVSNFGVKIYPNPSRELITVELSSAQHSDIKVTDVLGRNLILKTGVTEKTQIDLSGFLNGFYFIEIKTGNQFLQERIVKN